MNTYREKVRALYKKWRAEGEKASHALCSAKFEAKYGKHSHKRNLLPSRYDAYEGEEETVLPNGWKLKVEFAYDSDSGPPEKECDGFGETYRKVGYNFPTEAEQPWVLYSGHYDWLIYDWKAAYKEALRDKWGAKGFHRTPDERARAAVKATFDMLYNYYNENWWYTGLIIELRDENDDLLDEWSCWGFESNSMDYITETVRSEAAYLIKGVRREQQAERRQEKINMRFTEAMENAL